MRYDSNPLAVMSFAEYTCTIPLTKGGSDAHKADEAGLTVMWTLSLGDMLDRCCCLLYNVSFSRDQAYSEVARL